MTLIAVRDSREFHARSLATAEALRLPLVDETGGDGRYGLLLAVTGEGLSLQQTGPRAPGPVRCDFVAGSARHRRLYGGGKSQAIARAVGISAGFKPRIADLTAGLGRDGFVLAGLGAEVVMVERHPVIHALLEDGFRRARVCAEQDPALAEVLSRMTLCRGEGREWLAGCEPKAYPEVVFLDPMFPERLKSAEVKKEMAVFQQLVGGDEDCAALLEVALQTAIYRVVVKRPARAPHLGGREPGYSLQGRSTRFDIYPLKKMPASR